MDAWLSLLGLLGAAAITGFFSLKTVQARSTTQKSATVMETVAEGTAEMRDVVIDLLQENSRLRVANQTLESALRRAQEDLDRRRG